MNRQEILAGIEAANALLIKWKYNKAQKYFTDSGVTARSGYPKHIEFFEAGATHHIRGFIGGNGTGKSTSEGFETSLHMTGKYPEWWTGLKFTHPIDAWVCARETKNLREGIQEILFGGITEEEIGTGMIPRVDLLDDKKNLQVWAMAGTTHCIGLFRCKHYTNGIFDGWSKCEFKTYAQGWKEFQGPTRHWIVLDEEPDDVKVYAECLARLRPKDGGKAGSLAAYFTPKAGQSHTYKAFVPFRGFAGGEHTQNPDKYTIIVSARKVPHLPSEYIKSLIEELKISDPMNIEACIDGIAAMGSGLVYPVDMEFVVVPKMPIPVHWPKAYGLDPGYANTAVLWLAQDPNTGIIYIYDEYKNGRVNYVIHADAIKARGEWLWGAIDKFEANKPRDTGETVQTYFESKGLNLVSATGNKDALIVRTRAMLENGTLKIMDNCVQIQQEINTYRFDTNDPNKVAKDQDDHLLDSSSHILSVFEEIKKAYCDVENEELNNRRGTQHDNSDYGQNPYTGY